MTKYDQESPQHKKVASVGKEGKNGPQECQSIPGSALGQGHASQ